MSRSPQEKSKGGCVGAQKTSRFKMWAKYQITDMGMVEPMHRYDAEKLRFWLDSPAGHLEVRMKRPRDVMVFRDKYINWFEGCSKDAEFFELYKDIKENFKAKRIIYKANLHTRLKGRICGLIS